MTLWTDQRRVGSHWNEGALRRAVDEPAAADDAARAHLLSCERCAEALRTVREDASALRALLDTPAPELESAQVDASLALLRERLAEGHQGLAPLQLARPRLSRASFALRKPAIAAAAAALVVIGSTAAAAAGGWLPIVHPQTVAPVTVNLADLQALPPLEAYGTLSTPAGLQPEVVASAEAAKARTGLDVPVVAKLPAGVTGPATYAVVPATHAEFTFSATKAAQAARSQGATLPPMPAGLDGSSLRLDLGPMVAAAWTQGGQLPTLVVGRTPAPTVSSQGASLNTLETYLLAQPGISPELAAQVRALTSSGAVLPIAVPSDLATTSSTTVRGAEATLITLHDRSGAALVWIEGGNLNVVFGLLSAKDLHAVADGLR